MAGLLSNFSNGFQDEKTQKPLGFLESVGLGDEDPNKYARMQMFANSFTTAGVPSDPMRGVAQAAALGQNAKRQREQDAYGLQEREEEKQRQAAGAEKALTAHQANMDYINANHPNMTGITQSNPDFAQKFINQQVGKGEEGPEYGLNPIKGYDADGNPVFLQTSKTGTVKAVDLPEGWSPQGRYEKTDLGTEWLITDTTNGTQERIPKENEQAAFDKSYGSATGKATADGEASAPADISSAESALSIIGQIREHPELEWATGTSAGIGGNKIPGTGRFNFQNLVDQAKSGAFLTAVSQMRGLGALSNSEGGAATQAITRMNTALSTDAFLKALDDYELIVKGGLERAQGKLGGANQPRGGVDYSTMSDDDLLNQLGN